ALPAAAQRLDVRAGDTPVQGKVVGPIPFTVGATREILMKTAITELFGIQHPIIQGGMHYVGFAELAAAVSNAGGLAIIPGVRQKSREWRPRETAPRRAGTDKPFGVNLPFLPSFTAPPYPEYIAAIREGGVKAVETAGRSPEQYMPALKAAGIKVIQK